MRLVATFACAVACGLCQTDSIAAKNAGVLISSQIELIEKKLPWILYSDALGGFVEAKTKMRNAEESLAQREQDFQDSQEPLR